MICPYGNKYILYSLEPKTVPSENAKYIFKYKKYTILHTSFKYDYLLAS